MGRIAPLEPAQPQDDGRRRKGDACQSQQDDPRRRPDGVGIAQSRDQHREDRPDHGGNDDVERHDEQQAGNQGDRVCERRQPVLHRQAGRGQAAGTGRHTFAVSSAVHGPQADSHQPGQDRCQDREPPGRGDRRHRHAGNRKTEESGKQESEQPAKIRRSLGPRNPRRRRFRQPRKQPQHRVAQPDVDLLRRNGPIWIGCCRAGLRKLAPDGQEEIPLAQDPVPLESPVTLMKDARAQGPALQVSDDRLARVRLRDGIVGGPVIVRRALAASQHRPKTISQRCFHVAPEGSRRSVEIGLDHEDRIVVGTLEDRHRQEVQRRHSVLEPTVSLRPLLFLLAFERLDEV